MPLINITAFDPSMRNLGIALSCFNTSTRAITVNTLVLGTTESDAGKTVRKNSDDLRRAEHIVEQMEKYVLTADIVMSEIPTGSQNARAMLGNGIVLGALAGIKRRKPLIQVQPTETKVASVGRKTATKEEMINWATGLYPDLNWLTRKHKGKVELIAANEHLADAVGVIHAGITTTEFKAAIAMFVAANKAAA